MTTTHILISSVTVGAGGQSSISFTSIPNTYTDLLLKVSARCSDASLTNNLYLRLNSDSGNNYPYTKLYFAFPSTIASNTSDQEGFTNYAWLGSVPGANATSNTFGNVEIYIPNYTLSTYKNMRGDSVVENNTTGGQTGFFSSVWNSGSVVTAVTLTPNAGNFAQYSTAYLYGIKNS